MHALRTLSTLALAAAMLLHTSGCIWGYPVDSVYPADVSSERPSYAGFTVGERYTVIAPIAVWGDVLNVGGEPVTPHRLDAPVEELPAGTKFSIIAIRRWQTITTGYQYWPEVRVTSGNHAGEIMKIDAARDGTPNPALLARINRDR